MSRQWTVSRTVTVTVWSLGVLLCGGGADLAAQGPDDEQQHRFELTVECGIAGVIPYAAYSDARTSPFLEALDDGQRALVAGLGVRLYERANLSTAVQVDWGHVGDVTISQTSASVASSPGVTYTLERALRPRAFTLSITQALDFRPRARVRPWLGGGFAFSRLSTDQVSTQRGVSDPGYYYASSESFSLKRVGVTFGGGIKGYAGRHMLAGVEAGLLHVFGWHSVSPEFAGDRTTVSPETHPFLKAHVGVAF